MAKKPYTPAREETYSNGQKTFYWGRITVYPPEDPNILHNHFTPAKVNWSACGSQEVRVTRSFAKDLLKACKHAATLNLKQKARIHRGK